MEVRDLEHFVAVAEELHFGRAAARLRVVPAAVSQRVRELEAELGVQLFDRTSRTVALTTAGQALVGPARMVLEDVSAVSALGMALANGASGQVRLSVAPNLGGFGSSFVSELVTALPGLEAVGHSLWGVQGLDALVAGEVDVAVVRGPVDRDGLDTVPIGTYRDAYVAISVHDPVHDLEEGESVSLTRFQDRPFLIPDRRLAPVVHDRTVAFFREHGVAPLWRHHRLQSYDQMMTFVAAGYAAGLVHTHLAETHFPEVRILPLTQAAPAYDVVVAWRSGDTSPAVGHIAAIAQAARRRQTPDGASA